MSCLLRRGAGRGPGGAAACQSRATRGHWPKRGCSLGATDDTLTIVTGASSNHFRCLGHLLRSIDRYETAALVVYDLGLAAGEAEALRAAGRRVVRFPFERYPAYFGDAARVGAPCAWKPVLIREVIEGSAGAVVWMDAGNLVHDRLDRLRAVLAGTGFYSPKSSGTIRTFTHPQVLRLLAAEPEILDDRNRNGAIVGFGRNAIGIELSQQWRDCALREEIMAPPGWTKVRWRSDQAILSVLVAQRRRRDGFALVDELLGASYQNDHLTERQARLYMQCPPSVRGAGPALRERARRRRPLIRAWRAARRLLRRLGWRAPAA